MSAVPTGIEPHQADTNIQPLACDKTITNENNSGLTQSPTSQIPISSSRRVLFYMEVTLSQPLLYLLNQCNVIAFE